MLLYHLFSPCVDVSPDFTIWSGSVLRCVIGHQQIDRDNILQATMTGMARAVSLLSGSKDYTKDSELDEPSSKAHALGQGNCNVNFILVDGNRVPKVR